ncbi:hypothetical protein [Amphritea pacifica]|uniref:hypothetical protein n=1 Tax=Amphritea pacifica TaxID=2811233 RepID=UPI001965E5E9|nr:hypothetical protein [Amphritea pacifica]MBN1006599.1 hypothetical protein [Amphritea pacifica]
MMTLSLVKKTVVTASLLLGLAILSLNYFGSSSNTIKKFSVGSINGVPIKVPNNYIYYPFQYSDSSYWSKNKSTGRVERTYSDSVNAFSLYVAWEDLKPYRNNFGEIELNPTDMSIKKKLMMISLDSIYMKGKIIDENGRNGISRILNLIINRLNDNYVEAGPWGDRRKVSVKYIYRGIDKKTGLNYSEPDGPYVELFHTWNQSLFWSGNKDGVVDDLIVCWNGKLINPSSFKVCQHTFSFPEMKAYVTLEYPRSILYKWNELKEKSKKLIYRYKI